MTPDADLDGCQLIVEDGDESQWRQIHPRFVDGDVISREAFVGTPGASDEVSTARASVTTSEAAYRHHREELGLESCGTWAVTVTEVGEAGCRVIDDAACEGVDTPGHSFLDMRGLSRAARRTARTELATRATTRGRMHP